MITIRMIFDAKHANSKTIIRNILIFALTNCVRSLESAALFA